MTDEIVSQDLPEATSLLKDAKEKADAAVKSVRNLLSRAENGDFETEKGITFLEMKNHTLLSYLNNLTHVIWKKFNGQSINGDKAIKRLVEHRTVLERIRPIDHKLKYQIDKLVRTAAMGTINPDDPLRFKARPENLMTQSGDEESSEDEQEEGMEVDKGKISSKKPKAYVPPRLAPMPYDGDETKHDRKQKLLERAKKKALSSSIIEDLRKEYYDGPEEIKEVVDLHKIKENKAEKERIRYEEENMIRFNLTKKEKYTSRQLGAMSQLSGITRFGDISALNSEDLEDVHPKKKSKRVYKKKWGKKGFKRRKH